LLFFLEFAGNGLELVELQKLLLLYTKETQSPHYAFVPFFYGGYSFQCADDLELLEKRGWVTSEDNRLSLKADLGKQKWAVTSEERKIVRWWLRKNPERGEVLIAETYRRYPYYAIFSEIAKQHLTSPEMKAVDSLRDSLESKKETVVFTIGYEGILFEEYLNKLINNRVTMLCDVRGNPRSRKFGFSDLMLARILPEIGIKYLHLPELGIESQKRQNLNSREAYDELFEEYRQELPQRRAGLDKLKEQIDLEKRVALTCFEKHPHCCHRHCISEFLQSEYGYQIEHL
jgi:hypothetical protein